MKPSISIVNRNKCKHCENEIKGRSDMLFCSKKCNVAHNREKQKEKHLAFLERNENLTVYSELLDYSLFDINNTKDYIKIILEYKKLIEEREQYLLDYDLTEEQINNINNFITECKNEVTHLQTEIYTFLEETIESIKELKEDFLDEFIVNEDDLESTKNILGFPNEEDEDEEEDEEEDEDEGELQD